jgi:hypothetical protein
MRTDHWGRADALFANVLEDAVMTGFAHNRLCQISRDLFRLAVPQHNAPLPVGNIDPGVQLIQHPQKRLDIKRECIRHERTFENGTLVVNRR